MSTKRATPPGVGIDSTAKVSRGDWDFAFESFCRLGDIAPTKIPLRYISAEMSERDPIEVPEAMWDVLVQPTVKPLRVVMTVNRSPAARSEVQPGDHIKTVEGRPVASYAELIEILKTKEPGAMLQATLERAGSLIEMACVLEHRLQPEPPRKGTQARGSRDNSMEPS